MKNNRCRVTANRGSGRNFARFGLSTEDAGIRRLRVQATLSHPLRRGFLHQ